MMKKIFVYILLLLETWIFLLSLLKYFTLTLTLSPQGRGNCPVFGLIPSPLRGEGYGEGDNFGVHLLYKFLNYK